MSGARIRVLALMGPTAMGKTECAVELVRRGPFEIVSVDSAMIYRGMDIGSATPKPEVLAAAPHRMINILDPAETFSAHAFARAARAHIRQIHAAGRLPLLVGGSRLYFLALMQGLAPMPDAHPEVRRRLRREHRELGVRALHGRLRECDPAMARRLAPTDTQRILRALEVFESTRRPMSAWLAAAPVRAAGDIAYHQLALWPEDRTRLHRRINARFDRMLDEGLIEETRALHARADLTLECQAMRCVGYRQVWRFLDGACSRDEMRAQAAAATRQLAKRQLTWLRHAPDVIHCGMDRLQPAKVVAAVERLRLEPV